MRALRLHSFTDDSVAGVVRVHHVEPPVVDGPDDVIVRIAGAGVCRTDLHIVEGQPVGSGRVEIVTTHYPLDRAGDALDDLRDGRIVGRAVLVP